MEKRMKIGGHWPAHMDKTEARICNAIITGCLDAGYAIRVRDGEVGDTFAGPTTSRAEIQRATAQTAMTVYDVMRDTRFDDGADLSGATHERIGGILLVHGNGADVLADMGWPAGKPENEAILEAVTARATEIANEVV